jgi:hypothetical protein
MVFVIVNYLFKFALRDIYTPIGDLTIEQSFQINNEQLLHPNLGVVPKISTFFKNIVISSTHKK